MAKPSKFSDKDKTWNNPSRERLVDSRPWRQRILIVCEGEKTEPNYFEAIKAVLEKGTAEIHITGEGKNTLSLVEDAIAKRDRISASDRPYDQVWVVFDRDDFPAAHFDNAINKAKYNKISVAYSNQAFELWYLLHFEYQQAALNRDSYGGRLSGHLGVPYEKNDPTLYHKVTTKGDEVQAINWAKQLLEKAPQPPSAANPSTTVFKLVETLNEFKRPPKSAT